MKTKLSVNINKVATIRNARGNGIPNLVNFALDCERYGAEGITIHPRPDQRHITYQDVFDLKRVVKTEFNIEGFPNKEFIDLVLQIKPQQVTLVPDPPDVLTSNAGWDTVTHFSFLKDIVLEFNNANIRTSLFIGTDLNYIEQAKKLNTNRIELYTEPYAFNYGISKENAIFDFILAYNKAVELGLGVNAGHDLNLENLKYLKEKLPLLKEVSIGHALISDCLYFGLENTIQLYLRQLN